MRLLVAAAVLAAALGSATTAPAGQKDVEERLTCQCGCGLTVHTCNHLQCAFAVPVRTEITKALAAGEDEDAIVAGYVEKYGEKILSSPTWTGFNLLAWYGPYIAILLAGALIVATMRRWRRAPAGAADEPTAMAGDETVDSEAKHRLARELEQLDR